MNLKIVLALITAIFVYISVYGKIYGKKRLITGAVKGVYYKNTNVNRTYKNMRTIADEFVQNPIPQWDNVLDMGDIYARGSHPFLKPNTRMAMKLFETASLCPDPIVAGSGRMKMSDLVENDVKEEDQRGDRIDDRFGIVVAEHAARIFDRLQKHSKNNTNTTPDDVISKRNSEMLRISNRVQEELVRPKKKTPSRAEARRMDRIGGGSQNAHDHGVTSAVKENVKNIHKEFNASKQKFQQHHEVIDRLCGVCSRVRDDPGTIGLTPDQISDAYDVAASLTEDKYSDTGVTQIGILDMVLWKIRTISDRQIRNNVQETLCKRLSSAVYDHGQVVCATGKISRIVSVFEGVFEESQKNVSLKIVEMEIAQLASKTREDLLKRVGPVGRKAYESTNSVPEYVAEMTNTLKTEVAKEYVEKLHMNPAILEPIVDTYTKVF